MIRDIEISDNNQYVVFHKKLWDNSEVVLAKCYCFSVDLENGTIVACIKETSVDALFSFIRIGFKNFNESPSEIGRRQEFYSRIDAIYREIEVTVNNVIDTLLPYASKFYKHQRDGILFSFFKRYTFLQYQMRTGKSITAASLSRIFNIRTTLIVCPSVARMGWFVDLTTTWGFDSLYFTMLDASKSRTFKAFDERFIIINYDVLEKHLPHILAADIGHIIIDEAHKIKNVHSARFRVISKIADKFESARITFLTGTSIANRFNDLFAYFKLTKHHLGENYKLFCDNFTITAAGRGGDRVTGAKNIADLRMKMQNFMIVRTMADCFDMPEDIVSKLVFEFDDYKPEYDAIIREMSSQKSISNLNSSIHSLNILVSKSKIKKIIEVLEDIVLETGKVVVFGSYKEPLRELEQHFRERCVLVDGSKSSNEKYRLRTVFNDDPSVTVFLGNYESAGEALDLSVASDVVTLNFPLTPRALQQALFRCKHPEKMKHLRIHYSFCQDSIDEHLYELIASKSRDINALLHDGKEVIELENLTELLIKKLLKRDDIIFTSPFSKANHQVPGEEVQETHEEKLEESLLHGDRPNITREPSAYIPVSNDLPRHVSVGEEISVGRNPPQGVGQSSESDMLGQKGLGDTGTPKYYLMVHNESDSLFISNEEEAQPNFNQECYEIFNHQDPEEVVKFGRHYQLTFAGNVDLSFNPHGEEPFKSRMAFSIPVATNLKESVPLFSEKDFTLKMTSKLIMIDQENIEVKDLNTSTGFQKPNF